jgi:uncharacterized protein
MTRMANPTAMEDKMASADLSPGERKLKAKRRRWWIIIAMLALAGFIPGFLLGYSEGEGLVDPQGVWPAWIVILLAATFLIAVPIGSLLLYRQMDELERDIHRKAAAMAGGVLVIVYPVWWLLWMGALAPEPIHWVLFLIFYATILLSWLYYRLRISAADLPPRLSTHPERNPTMKKLLTCLLAFTALSAPVHAQPAPAAATTPAAAANLPDADPPLWVVRDEDTTIYMLGTFHMLDGRPWFNDEVKTAFDASQELVLEVLLPEDPMAQQQLMAPLIMRYGVDPQGRTISSRLTTDEARKLAEQLSGLGLPVAAFERFEPWVVTLALTQAAAAKLNLQGSNGPEGVLRRAARERNMPEAELETSESQIRMFDSMPEESQVAGLKAMIANPNAGVESLRPMLDAWSRGDERAIAAITMAQDGQDPRSYDILFTNRNANWARWIDERLDRPGTVFMAVGAGHLVGRGSVQEHLQRLNIRTERVASPGASQDYPLCRSRADDRCRQRR